MDATNDVDALLQALRARADDLRNAIGKMELHHDKTTWPHMLEYFRVLSTHLLTLNEKLLPMLMHFVWHPKITPPPSVNLPVLFRTKLLPELEDVEKKLLEDYEAGEGRRMPMEVRLPALEERIRAFNRMIDDLDLFMGQSCVVPTTPTVKREKLPLSEEAQRVRPKLLETFNFGAGLHATSASMEGSPTSSLTPQPRMQQPIQSTTTPGSVASMPSLQPMTLKTSTTAPFVMPNMKLGHGMAQDVERLRQNIMAQPHTQVRSLATGPPQGSGLPWGALQRLPSTSFEQIDPTQADMLRQVRRPLPPRKPL